MSEKKKEKPAIRQKPEHVVRSGEVTAAIYRRQSTSGYPFLAFELRREWCSASTNRVFHAANFFEQHEKDVINAVREAVALIRQQTNGAMPNEPPPEEDGNAASGGFPQTRQLEDN